MKNGLAVNGHANPRSWCMLPRFGPYIDECQKGNLVKAGHAQFDRITSPDHPEFGAMVKYDASYCFIEGLCTNTAVTTNTTLAEAETMCDERFGHNTWVHFTGWDVVKVWVPSLLSGKLGDTTGFQDKAAPEAFAKAGCAMGNYHCDVIYCQAVYCQDAYYVQTYGHLQPHVNTSLDQVNEGLQSKAEL